MIELIASLAVSTQNPCSGWEQDRLIEDFNACLSGEWGEEPDCTEGRTISYDGYINAEGQSCRFNYMIWDPHTGGFRLRPECTDDNGDVIEGDVSVWIVENGVINSGSQVGGFTPELYRCEVPE